MKVSVRIVVSISLQLDSHPKHRFQKHHLKFCSKLLRRRNQLRLWIYLQLVFRICLASRRVSLNPRILVSHFVLLLDIRESQTGPRSEQLRFDSLVSCKMILVITSMELFKKYFINEWTSKKVFIYLSHCKLQSPFQQPLTNSHQQSFHSSSHAQKLSRASYCRALHQQTLETLQKHNRECNIYHSPALGIDRCMFWFLLNLSEALDNSNKHEGYAAWMQNNLMTIHWLTKNERWINVKFSQVRIEKIFTEKPNNKIASSENILKVKQPKSYW